MKKKCNTCKQDKELNRDNFNKGTNADGFRNDCKECQSRLSKEYNLKKKKEQQEYFEAFIF